MADNTPSLRQQIVLLVVDKLIIGAIVAFAFVAYDRWKTADLRHYDQTSQEHDLPFRRAEYIRTLVPLVVDPKNEIHLRLQAFGALVDTRSVDAGGATALARIIFRTMLSDIVRFGDDTMRSSILETEHFLQGSILKLSPAVIAPCIDAFNVTQHTSDTSGRVVASAWEGFFWSGLVVDMLSQFVDSTTSPLDSGVLASFPLATLVRVSKVGIANGPSWRKARSRRLRLIGNVLPLLELPEGSSIDSTLDSVQTSQVAEAIETASSSQSLSDGQSILLELRNDRLRSAVLGLAAIAAATSSTSPDTGLVPPRVIAERAFVAGQYLSFLATSKKETRILIPAAVKALAGLADSLRSTSEQTVLANPDLFTGAGGVARFLAAAERCGTTLPMDAKTVLETIRSELHTHPYEESLYAFAGVRGLESCLQMTT